MEPVVDRLLVALRDGDRETVRLTLHPYLHWQLEDGTVLRGRKRILLLLEQAPIPGPPSAVELRDGQIYRWRR